MALGTFFYPLWTHNRLDIILLNLSSWEYTIMIEDIVIGVIVFGCILFFVRFLWQAFHPNKEGSQCHGGCQCSGRQDQCGKHCP